MTRTQASIGHFMRPQRREAHIATQLPLGHLGDDTEAAPPLFTDLGGVVAASVALGAAECGGPLSLAEQRLVQRSPPWPGNLHGLREAIGAGADPLGEALSALRQPQTRRKLGAFYTPLAVVRRMADWVLDQGPARIVDPGSGSGRFACELVRRRSSVPILAIDIDPVATLSCRAALAVLGARETQVINADFTSVGLPSIQRRTAFIGNPPYVRHHLLSAQQKRRAKALAARLGLDLSGLSGLHVHFFLTTFNLAQRGDVGCFITGSEWLDVGYGSILREALSNGFGALSLHLLDPRSSTFEDAMSTALVCCFAVEHRPHTIRLEHVGSVEDLGALGRRGKPVPANLLRQASRWTPLFLDQIEAQPNGLIPLGRIVRVSRGAVTGANGYFVLDVLRARQLGLTPYTTPVLRSARVILEAGGRVDASSTDRVLLDPPRHMDLEAPEHAALRRYLRSGEGQGVPDGYICRHRRPWWHVGAQRPPVVATYMARQPPAFALNPDRLAILNVLHGLYPRISLDEAQLRGLVAYLNGRRAELRGHGRTYHGGLEKFEPREMEALLVPEPGRLHEFSAE